MILAARRPLSLAELSIALAFQDTEQVGGNVSDFIVPQTRFREHLRDLCGLFVTVVDAKVYLLHQTARAFLLCNEKSAEDALQRGVQQSICDGQHYV